MTESTKEIRIALQRRHVLLRAIRDWFHQEGFIEVDAPVLVPGTGCEPFIDPMETAFMLSAEGEMQKRYLHTSPELYLKRLLARVPEPLFFFMADNI